MYDSLTVGAEMKRRATVKFLEKKFKGKWVRWENAFGDVYVFKVRRVSRSDKGSRYPAGWLYDKRELRDKQWHSGYAAEYAKVITYEQALALQL